MLRILSLGAGVQSTTVLLMSIRGDLPKLDAAVFADTGWEPRAVYAHLNWLEAQAHQADIPVHRVSVGRSIRDDAVIRQVRGTKGAGERWASMPYFVRGPKGVGMIRRQCTGEYKIAPLKREIRALVGLKPRCRSKDLLCEHWFGISSDEAKRARHAAESWSVNVYPLIDMDMSRRDCLEWCSDHGYASPPRSSCIGCPFKSNAEWARLRDESPGEWEDACEFDEAVRKCGGMRGDVYLHRSCVPLREADLRTKDERAGQILIGDWREECAGLCGV